MLYRLTADAVVLLHVGFIVFVISGGFLAWRWPRLIWVHLPAALWGTAIELCHWVCPLTPLEKQLRQLSGDAGYEGGFIEHYLIPIIYPAALTTWHQVVLGISVVLLNTIAYAVYFRRRRLANP